MSFGLLLLTALVGCESEAEIAAEMERGLLSANEALVPVLFAAETLAPVLAPVDEPLARHGTACGACPCVTRSGPETGPSQITLDYEAGCLPSSGLLPTLLQGHSEIVWTGSEAMAAWSNLVFRLEDPVSGALGGPIALDGAATHIEAAGDLDIGLQGYGLEAAIVVDEAGVRADGEVDVAGRSFGAVVLEGIEISYDGIRAACPSPDSGTARLLNPEDPDEDVIVDFGEPGGGAVTVTRDDRVSEAVDLCAYGSARL